MNENIKDLMDGLKCKDNKVRKEALDKVIEITDDKVDWIYNYWNLLVDKLDSNNSYQRTIGMLILSNLAKSDYENRFEEIMVKYLKLTEDEKFITARQTLQTMWKVAIANENCRKKIVEDLSKKFINNIYLNTHANLIRKDIIESICKIYNYDNDAVDINYFRLKIEENYDQKEQTILLNIIKSQMR